MILDSEVPNADPTELILQYRTYIFKLANRYRRVIEDYPSVDYDDLCQAGYMGILEAQKKYDPEKCSFMYLLFYLCRKQMRKIIGYNNQTGERPIVLASLDEPLNDETDDTLVDMIPDGKPETEEAYIEDEAKNESAKIVRDAVDRLKNERQRESVKLVYLNGLKQKDAAAIMGIPNQTVSLSLHKAIKNLYRDTQLRDLYYPDYRITLEKFNATWTSPVEAAVIWREEHYWNRLAKLEERIEKMQKMKAEALKKYPWLSEENPLFSDESPLFSDW